jgi:hypothetical protein
VRSLRTRRTSSSTAARTPEPFAGGTAAAPTVLSVPFDACEEADVARFLQCIYCTFGSDAQVVNALAAVLTAVRLAHALDAGSVLQAGRQHHLAAMLAAPVAPTAVLVNTASLSLSCG